MQPVDVSIVVSDHDHDDKNVFDFDVPTSSTTSSNSSSGTNGTEHLTVETAYDEIEYFTYRAPRGTSGSESSSTDSASCASDSVLVQQRLIQQLANEDSNENGNSYDEEIYIDDEDEYFEGDDGLLVGQGDVMILKNSDWDDGTDDTDYSYTVQCGWVVLFSTWIIFVLGVGSMFGVWKWVWAPALEDMSHNSISVLEPVGTIDEESDFPIEEYYPSMIMLLCVVAWIWCVVSWVGMKLFRHAKGGVSSDSAPQSAAESGPESPPAFKASS
ncbi:hypothetical protein POJ06DRAFT_234949 [Lipomyces tetrasporus]|uniref:Uncharacterized protein n=1 Tax=Lipomyces tetrasporus TaxID=54092 RepID=A0AAD7QYT7_9ASCO|nr:uncharacterized protein POJ06DRAFT_234949 [Lipomyces tetrasporus]KAJ8103969.1 hypothetical protein POJ06DRAFT_234949 [Lipomyces tetrasporus]